MSNFTAAQATGGLLSGLYNLEVEQPVLGSEKAMEQDDFNRPSSPKFVRISTPLPFTISDNVPTARKPQSDVWATFNMMNNPASIEGSAGQFTLGGPISSSIADADYEEERSVLAMYGAGKSYSELVNLPSGKEVESALAKDVDLLKQNGYNIPFWNMSAREAVQAVANAKSVIRSQEDRIGLFESGSAWISGGAALAMTMVSDPVNWIEFGGSTAIRGIGTGILRSSTKAGTVSNRIANLVMRNAVTREPLKWITRNAVIPTIKSVDELVSMKAVPSLSVREKVLISSGLNAAQTAAQGFSLNAGMEQYGAEKNYVNTAMETVMAGMFTAGLATTIIGATAAKKAWWTKPANSPTEDLSDRITRSLMDHTGDTAPPKWQLPQNGGPDDTLNISVRSSLAEEIAYQMNRLFKNPFYQANKVLDARWWDVHVDSGIDQSLFLEFLRKNNPSKAEIDMFVNTIESLDRLKKAEKYGKNIDDDLENSWASFVENELEVQGVPIRLSTETSQVKNRAWFMANVKEFLTKGNAPKVTKTLPDGSVVTVIDEADLNDQVLALTAIVASRAGKLGISVDDYIFRTFKNFVFDPRKGDLTGQVLFSMMGPSWRTGWKTTTAEVYSEMRKDIKPGEQGHGLYVETNKNAVDNFRGTVQHTGKDGVTEMDVRINGDSEALVSDRSFDSHSIDVQMNYTKTLRQVLERLYPNMTRSMNDVELIDLAVYLMRDVGETTEFTGQKMYLLLAKLTDDTVQSDIVSRKLTLTADTAIDSTGNRVVGLDTAKSNLKNFLSNVDKQFKYTDKLDSVVGNNASTLLKQNGIFAHIFSKEGDLDGMVVFDTSKIVINDILYSDIRAGRVKSAVKFDATGKAIVYGFKNTTDIASLSRSIGYVFRRELKPEELARLSQWAGVDKNEMDNWSPVAEEKFAKAFERYLAIGIAPNKAMERVFANYNRWMFEIYGSLKNSEIKGSMSAGLINSFESILSMKKFQKRFKSYADVIVGPEERTGEINLIIEDPTDRLIIQFMKTSDPDERLYLLQKLREDLNMPDEHILYYASRVWKEVQRQISIAKKELKKAAKNAPDAPKRTTISQYVTKFQKSSYSKKMVRLAARIFAKYDTSAVEFFVDNVYKLFDSIASKMKVSVDAASKSKIWIYMETAGHLFDGRNPFTDPDLIEEMVDIQLGRLVNTDPKATRETLRNAGKKLRADSTLVPDIVGNIKLRPDLVDKLPDLKTMRAKVETAYPTIDVRVSAIKIDPPTDKELARLAGRVIDPKDPSTAFTRATRQVLEARTERTAVAAEGSAEAIKQANIKLRRALRNLRRVQNFNYVPKTDVSPSQVVGEIEFGVVEKSPGQSLTPEEAATVLNNANTQGLFGSGNENWLVYAAKESLRKLRKLGNIFDQGSLATVGSEIPIIARLSHLISSHNLYTDSFGFSKLVGPGLEQRKRRVISKVSKVVVDLFDDTKNLDDTTQQLLMQHAMAKVNNIAMTPLTPDLDKIADSMANRLRFLFQEFERRGLSSGYFRGTLDSYSGTFMIRPDKRDLSGLTEAFYKYFERKFTDPNATLHRKTMHDVPGWYKYDTATNKWIPDEIAKRYTKIPENLSDLTAADQATYLGILRNTATDPSGNYIQGLRLEAQKAAKNKLGMVEYKDSADIALVRPDATMERSLEVDIWFDPDVAQFVDWRIGEGLMSYANTTAYRISEKEGINLFVQSLLGVNRLDFTSSSLVDGIESVVLNNPALDDVARNKIKQSFQFLRNQVNALRESSVSDITRKQGITDDLVTIMGSIARVPVSARSALAGTVTELPMLLMSVLAKDGAAGVGRIVKDILNGATQDQLKGIIAGYQWMRNHIPFTLQYVAESTTINRNWLDKVWVNPVKSIVGAETAMDKTKAVAAWLHHASSGLAGEDLFQGWVSGIAVHSASVRMIRFLDKMVDLSNRMQSYNWAIEKDPERVFRRLAREAGFGEDAAYAARLNQAGLLDPNTLKELFEIDKLSGGRLLDKDNGSLNHGILEDILINNPKYRDTIERIIGFKETELTRHVTVPGVQDVNIPMGGLDPASKLKNMFTGFARSWFNNIMLNHIGNEKLAYSLFIISVGLVGEALYNTALRTLYHDESLESVLEEWEKEPVSSTALVFGRSNMLGTANIIPMLVVDMFAKSNGASTQASSLYPVTQTMKLMRSSANIIKASLDSDKEVSEQDANVTESFILGFNAWWMKSIYDATGWNGPAHWLLGIDPKKQPAT